MIDELSPDHCHKRETLGGSVLILENLDFGRNLRRRTLHSKNVIY